MRDAKTWAALREAEIRTNKEGKILDFPIGMAIDKYISDIVPTHRGGRTEEKRLLSIKQTLPCTKPLIVFDNMFWDQWSKQRLKTPVKNRPSSNISAGTVRREITILRAVFEYARVQLKWIKQNPFDDVIRPPSPKSRNRIITIEESQAIFSYLKYKRGGRIVSIGQQVGAMFDLALQSGMRAGEIASLTWENILIDKFYVHLPLTKNGESRDVPLTNESVEILNSMRNVNDDEVFAPNTQTLDAYFRKARKGAGVSGFTFHDARHTAATSIAERLKSTGIESQQALMDFCKIFGWKNISQALVYYNPNPTDIARRLNSLI